MANGGYNITVKAFVPCDTGNPAEAIKTLQAIEDAKADQSKIGELLASKGVEVDSFDIRPISRRGKRGE